MKEFILERGRYYLSWNQVIFLNASFDFVLLIFIILSIHLSLGDQLLFLGFQALLIASQDSKVLSLYDFFIFIRAIHHYFLNPLFQILFKLNDVIFSFLVNFVNGWDDLFIKLANVYHFIVDVGLGFIFPAQFQFIYRTLN